jgi:acetyl esterase/lipase
MSTPTPVPNLPSVPLWNGPAPLSRGSSSDDTPRLFPYLLEKAARPTPAIILIPGGGYWEWCYEHESLHMADWFRERGIAAFTLFYRRAPHGYRHPAPMLDGQRAVRFVRSRAVEWNIDPAKIAILGFSAGGHLASTLATKFDDGDAKATDPVERQSCRPDFAALIYPVITLREPGAINGGSKTNLLGENPDPALVESLSSETQVTPRTPPTVLVHPADDTVVPIENSRLMLAALQKAGVPCELQEYPKGGHGFGFGPKQTLAPAHWLDRVQEWLEAQGFKA